MLPPAHSRRVATQLSGLWHPLRAVDHHEAHLITPVRLTERHAPALDELLHEEPLVNLFLIGYLDASPVSRSHWYGVLDGDRVVAAVVVVTGRLAVAWAPDPSHAEALGALLHHRHRPTMMVGPREATDHIWAAWASGVPVDRWHDQHLYVCDAAVPGPLLSGFRQARMAEWETVALYAARMEQEDLGRSQEASSFEATIKRRLTNGSTWVLERDQEIVFQINVGTITPFGAQVGGTYVPPALRGQGIATEGMRELGRRLLSRHRRLTLHVNEANTPAVAAYERSGYRRHAPYRLITLQGAG